MISEPLIEGCVSLTILCTYLQSVLRNIRMAESSEDPEGEIADQIG